MTTAPSIYFVYTRPEFQDDPIFQRRGYQIAKCFPSAAVISNSESDTIQDSVIICFHEHDPIQIPIWKQNRNVVILDYTFGSVVDPFDGVIVTSVYRKRYLLEVCKYYGPVEVIYDPWLSTDTISENTWLEVNGWKVMPDLDPTPSRSNLELSIAAKLEMVTMAVPTSISLDLLGSDYPFYLSALTGESLIAKWKQIQAEVGTATWNQAKDKMNSVRDQTSLSAIGSQYLRFVSSVSKMKASWNQFQTWQRSRNNSIVVYTAIFGGYDTLPPISSEVKEDSVDYVCFTDEPDLYLNSGYKLVYVPLKWNGTVDNREPKLRYHHYLSDYAYSLYFDGGSFLIQKVSPIVEKLLQNHDLAIVKHPWQTCLYQECSDMIKYQNIADIDRATLRIQKYRSEGYPSDAGLTINHILLRRHTPALEKVMDDWMDEYLEVQRDQLCLEYVLWKHQLPINRIDWSEPNLLKDTVDYLLVHERDRVLVRKHWPKKFVVLD